MQINDVHSSSRATNYRGLNVLGHIVKPMTPDALSGLLAKLYSEWQPY